MIRNCDLANRLIIRFLNFQILIFLKKLPYFYAVLKKSNNYVNT